jgi:3-hydroxybutyryl-CoA dehydrogenase
VSYVCEGCDRHWSYPVRHCIFCGSAIREVNGSKYTVIGSTQINIPSTGNEKVPYFDYLLEDQRGDKVIVKSFDGHEIGDVMDVSEAPSGSLSVGVVGTGTLGSGIAEHILRRGHAVTVKTRSGAKAEKWKSGLVGKLARGNTEAQVKTMLGKLTVTMSYSDLRSCDIVIEAASEDIGIKREVFEALSGMCKPGTIFATNTSSLSIDEIAAYTDRPGRVIGMHFFNPVSKMDLVEVIAGKETSDETRDLILSFCATLGKRPVVLRNSPGFIVNRLLLPQINDAIRLFEEGIASKEDIDAAMKLGLNHPMGPFALADLIGLDVCCSILGTLHRSLGDERYRPAATLSRLVAEGRLGVKSGAGFYEHG